MGLLELLQQGQTQLSAGSFPNDAPINDPQSGFIQDNSPENTYENETVGQFNNGSVLSNTLGSTGLDTTDFTQNTGTPVPTWDWVTNYPELVSGEFNGAPSLYGLAYAAENTYLDNVSIGDSDSPQLSTLTQTGLDNTNANAEGTTIVPNNVSYPNNYPAIEGVNLGGFGGPEQYNTNWNQDNTYLNSFNPDLDNSIQFAFTGSNLDNSSTGVSALSHVIPPISIYKPNDYPIIPNVNLGEFNTGPSQYVTPYNPTNTYLDQYNELKDVNTNPQKNTLNKTALDVDDSGSLPTSLIYAPTNPDTITEYPAFNATGATGSYAQGFNQIWRPVKRYYNDYIKPLKDQNLV